MTLAEDLSETTVILILKFVITEQKNAMAKHFSIFSVPPSVTVETYSWSQICLDYNQVCADMDL